MKLAIFLLSGAVLAHQVCLLRALAIAYQGHAASFVVSVALVGFGAAGTLLALRPSLKRPATVAAAAALYALLIPLSLRVASAIDFNVLLVGWDRSAWLGLLALQATFLVPFLVAALGIYVALALDAKRPDRMYGANLLGSGVGAAAAAPLLTLGAPEQILVYVALAATAAAALVPGRRSKLLALAGIGGLVLLGPSMLPMSPFKDLPATPGARTIATRFGPLGRVDRVASPSIHDAPGLSLASHAPLPAQDGLFVDGQRIAVVDLADSEYLADTVDALPFVLGRPERVVLLGVGPNLGRADVVIDADANRLALSGATGVVATPRAWMERPTEPCDLLILNLEAGDPIQEDPLFTVEAFRAALVCVGQDGVVAVSTHLTTPPRPGLKVLALADAVTPHVVAIRAFGRLTAALLQRPPTEEALERVRQFCESRGFDVVRPVDRRSAAPFHATATPLAAVGADYPFDVRAPTDRRPYVNRVFRWSRLGDVLEADAIPYVSWRFVVRVVAFAQIVVLGLVLLVIPLIVSKAARAPAPLFLVLGLAYMLLEMAFLSQATVRLGGAAPAAAAVIGGFLVGSGFGSILGESLGRPLRGAALIVALVALPGFAFLPASFAGIALVSALVAVPMGMPFPAALARLPGPSVPWALAVNGCASVAAAAGAPLLSTTFSIPATAALGAVGYLAVTLGARAVSPAR